MAVSRNATYVQSVEMYVEENDEWMTTSEQPLVTSLYKAAQALDNRTTASLLGEFRQVIRELHKRKPGIPEEQKLDEFDELVKDFF